MNINSPIIKLNSIWFKLFFAALILFFISVVAFYSYLFFSNATVENVSDQKGTVLYVYVPFFSSSNPNNLQEEFVSNGWGFISSFPNKSLSSEVNKSDVVLIDTPKFSFLFNFLFENSLESLENFNEEVILIKKPTYKSFSYLSVLKDLDTNYHQPGDINSVDLLEFTENIFIKKDTAILDNFVVISEYLSSYYIRNAAIPTTLKDTEVERRLNAGDNNVDYKKINDAFYQICSNFAWSSDNSGSYGLYNAEHSKGYDCYTFSTQHEPFTSSQQEIRDELILKDFIEIHEYLNFLYSNSPALPLTLEPISSEVTTIDYFTKEVYEYRKISDDSYELCADFNTPKFLVKNYRVMDDKVCNRIVAGQSFLQTNTDFTIENAGFDNWLLYKGSLFPKSWYLLNYGENQDTFIRELSSSDNTFIKDFSLRINKNSTLLFNSLPQLVNSSQSYDLSIGYKTTSSCSDCAVLGIKVFDSSNNNISNNSLNSCGDFYAEGNMLVNYINPSEVDYFINKSVRCSFIDSAEYVELIFGLVKEDNSDWVFDNTFIYNAAVF